MISSPVEYMNIKVNFDPFDPFRKQRLQDAIDAFDELRFEKNQEIKKYQDTVKRQGEMLKKFSNENEKLKEQMTKILKENEQMKNSLSGLSHKTSMAESARLCSAQNVEKLSSENTELRMELCTIRQKYNELSDTHDRLVAAVRNEHIDIPVELL